MTTLREQVYKCSVLLLLISSVKGKVIKERVSGELDIKIGHGITPNFTPRYSPPRVTEHYPDMKQLLTIPFSSEEDPFLPNTYQSVPSFRYPYYDETGRGYLVYGYGDNNEVFTYSEFDDLEGYY